MKRILAALLAAMLLIACACAEYIGGDGWFDTDYIGDDILIQGSDLTVRVPSWWEDISFTEGMQMYRDTVDGMYFYLYTVDRETWNSYWHMSSDDCPYEESAFIILQQDRDWLVFADEYLLVAVTPIDSGAVVFEFQLFQDDDWVWARRIVSSVCDPWGC